MSLTTLAPRAHRRQGSATSATSANSATSMLSVCLRPKSYIHRPLADKEIRILHLHSDGPADQSLRCRISHVKAADAKYVALSYPWGATDEADFQLPIVSDDGVDEGTLPLTPNLHEALKDLKRSPIEPKVFWIDQICINQGDISDKERQVKRMGDIYHNALSVVTYAGPEAPRDECAIALLERLVAHYITPFFDTYKQSHFWAWLVNVEARSHDDAVERPIGLNLGNELRRRLHTPLPMDDGWQGLLDILIGPWGRRKWMIQENVLNHRTVILRGSRMLDQPNVLILAGILLYKLWNRRLPSGQIMTEQEMQHLSSVSMLWRVLRVKTHIKLGDLIHWFPNSLCSDPRDNIYALLSLAKDARQLGIQPDYSKTYQEVLHTTTVALLKKDGLTVYSRQRDLREDLPDDVSSWVPAWSPDSRASGLLRFPNPGRRTNHQFKRPTESYVRFEDSNRTLVIRVRKIGEITKMFGAVDRRPTYYIKELLQPQSTSPQPHVVGKVFQSAIDHLTSKGSLEDVHYTLACAFLTRSTWVHHSRHKEGVVKDAIDRTGCQQCAAEIRAAFPSAMRILTSGSAANTGSNPRPAMTEDDIKLGIEFVRSFGVHRSQLGFIGNVDKPCWTPLHAREGDMVVKAVGGPAAFVLRRKSWGTSRDAREEFMMVGTAFVHGYMVREAFELPGDWRMSAAEIRIT